MAGGRPPIGGFSRVAPELMVSDIARSMDFWCRCLDSRLSTNEQKAALLICSIPMVHRS